MQGGGDAERYRFSIASSRDNSHGKTRRVALGWAELKGLVPGTGDFVVRAAEDCALEMLPYFVRPKADNEGPEGEKERRADWTKCKKKPSTMLVIVLGNLSRLPLIGRC